MNQKRQLPFAEAAFVVRWTDRSWVDYRASRIVNVLRFCLHLARVEQIPARNLFMKLLRPP